MVSPPFHYAEESSPTLISQGAHNECEEENIFPMKVVNTLSAEIFYINHGDQRVFLN